MSLAIKHLNWSSKTRVGIQYTINCIGISKIIFELITRRDNKDQTTTVTFRILKSECTIYFLLIIFSFNCFFLRKNIIFAAEDLLTVGSIKIIFQLTIFSYEDLLSVDYFDEKKYIYIYIYIYVGMGSRHILNNATSLTMITPSPSPSCD